jgi:hypothetical protein
MRSTNEAASRVLAQAFSEPFTVFSAKKFPGMIGKRLDPYTPKYYANTKSRNTQKNWFILLLESTPLSRAFARQGVKIPIRKDASKSKKEDTAEEGEDE